MNAEEFVRSLGADNDARLARLAPDDTLKPEVDGALNVPNLLKVALKNEIEATEIAARWLVSTDDVAVKLALARQVGDEARHYRLIAERLGALGMDADTLDPLAGGYGPLFKYLDTLTTTVERVAFARDGAHCFGFLGRQWAVQVQVEIRLLQHPLQFDPHLGEVRLRLVHGMPLFQ